MEEAEGSVAVEVGSRRTLVLSPGAGRLQVGLVLAPLGKLVDITAQPSTAVRRVADTAQRDGMPLSAAEASCRRALQAMADRAGSWQAPPTTDLLAWFGGAGFPFLRVAYEAGCLPLEEVPRWAVPVLTEQSARAGALAAFGPRATRRVVAELGRSIARNPGEVADLSRLALALVASRAAEPDQLAALLAVPGPSWPLHDLPSGRLIDGGRRALRYWGDATRALRILTDAATVPGGPRLLAETIRYTLELNDHGPRRLPNRLAELHAVYRARFVHAAEPLARGSQQTPRAGPRRGAAADGRAAIGTDGGAERGVGWGAAIARRGPAGDRAEDGRGGVADLGGVVDRCGLIGGPARGGVAEGGRGGAVRGGVGGAAEGGGGGVVRGGVGGPAEGGRGDAVRGDARGGAAAGGGGGVVQGGVGGAPAERTDDGAGAGAGVAEVGPRYPPRVAEPTTVSTATPLRHPADVRALQGAAAGTVRLVLPCTVGDLVRWGAMLHNCLGDYGRAAASGRSIIVGVEVDGRLRYVVELTPERRIRQFCGRGNAAPPQRDFDRVVRLLDAHRVLAA